jgi:hypothetical protein
MTKTFATAGALALSLLACACAESPPPRPDPVELELALAAVEREASAPEARFQKKIAGADRLSSTLTKVAPEKLNPHVAEALLR